MVGETRLRSGRMPALRRVGLLALVVLGAALLLLWLVGRTLDRNRTTASNAQLVADLQVARATLQSDVAVAARKASTLAHMSRVETALARGDAVALQALASRHPDTLLVSARGVRRGSLAPLGVRRTVEVVSGSRTIGRVVTDAPLDASYLARVHAALPAGSRDLVVVTEHGRVVGGPLPAGRILSARSPRDVDVDGRTYRALDSALTRDRPELRIAAHARGSSSFVSAWRLPLAVLATLLALGAALLLPFDLLRRRERRQQPQRLTVEPREEGAETPVPANVAALGEKLAATNDVDSLLGVILDAAIKATGAAGGRVARPGEAASRSPDTGSEVLRVPLDTSEPGGNFALLLYPPPSGFGAEAAGVAHWLGEHASTAIRSARLHRVAQEDAIEDELTGLANRRQFTATLQREFGHAARTAAPLSLVLADLDNFKSFNERHGTQAGDQALQAFAATVRRCMRDVDVAARIGGEEFGVLLPETDAEGARQFTERLRSELRAREGLPEPVTASFGIASYPRARTAEQLLTGADTSVRRAKVDGKDRVVIADGSPSEAATA